MKKKGEFKFINGIILLLVGLVIALTVMSSFSGTLNTAATGVSNAGNQAIWGPLVVLFQPAGVVFLVIVAAVFILLFKQAWKSGK